jgi:hypothetical protein
MEFVEMKGVVESFLSIFSLFQGENMIRINNKLLTFLR